MISKYKIDIYIFAVFFSIGCIWILLTHLPENTGFKDFSNSQFTCVDSGHTGKYRGFYAHFVEEGQQYSIKGNFKTQKKCDEFRKLILGQEITGYYLTLNNVITELHIGKKVHYKPEHTFVTSFVSLLFLSMIAWALVRDLIKWLIRKLGKTNGSDLN